MRRSSVLLFAPFLLLVVHGCSTSNDSPEQSLDAGADGQGPLLPPVQTDAGADCGTALHCSADLHAIVDCNDRVVTKCPAEQGCTPALECVPACEAAAEAQSSFGCAYASVIPDTYDAPTARYRGDCYAAYVVNAWDAPTTISVTYGGQPVTNLDDFARVPVGSGRSLTFERLPGGMLGPGQVAVLFLAGQDDAPAACPGDVKPAVNDDDSWATGTRVRKAFRIESSLPVSAYDIYPFGGGNSALTGASLLLPASIWGKDYLAITAWPASAPYNVAPIFFAPWLTVIADTDDTKVTLTPSVKLVGGVGVAATDAKQPVTVTLARGQALQLTQEEDLIGSPVAADKPVAVFGGARCMNIPEGEQACDAAHQQLPQVHALGNEYVAVKPRDRYTGLSDPALWRIVAVTDGTKLSYVPHAPVGAPSELRAGEVIDFTAADPFVVRSQDGAHPFYLVEYMTGCEQAAASLVFSDCRGDPEFLVTIPPAQFATNYNFFTDPTYPETNVVVVRTAAVDGFHDVTLDCAGPLGNWASIPGTSFQWTRVDLVRHAWEPQGGCDNGRHGMSSDAPFGVTIWGWGSVESGSTQLGNPAFSEAVSYAYPAGGTAHHLNDAIPVPR